MILRSIYNQQSKQKKYDISLLNTFNYSKLYTNSQYLEYLKLTIPYSHNNLHIHITNPTNMHHDPHLFHKSKDDCEHLIYSCPNPITPNLSQLTFLF